MPLHPRSKRPNGALVPNGLLQATSYLPTLLHWWQREPNGNIGINCQASGLVVVDVDPRNDGAETLHGLVGTLGELPKTVEALTGGGGQHILFQHPRGLLRASLGPGVDIKDAGYIVTPPSLHPSGRSYDWSVDGHPDEVGVAELPDRWRERMERPSAGIARAFDHSASSATDDRLRNVPAMGYFAALTGRTVDHGGGQPVRSTGTAASAHRASSATARSGAASAPANRCRANRCWAATSTRWQGLSGAIRCRWPALTSQRCASA